MREEKTAFENITLGAVQTKEEEGAGAVQYNISQNSPCLGGKSSWGLQHPDSDHASLLPRSCNSETSNQSAHIISDTIY